MHSRIVSSREKCKDIRYGMFSVRHVSTSSQLQCATKTQEIRSLYVVKLIGSSLVRESRRMSVETRKTLQTTSVIIWGDNILFQQ